MYNSGCELKKRSLIGYI